MADPRLLATGGGAFFLVSSSVLIISARRCSLAAISSCIDGFAAVVGGAFRDEFGVSFALAIASTSDGRLVSVLAWLLKSCGGTGGGPGAGGMGGAPEGPEGASRAGYGSDSLNEPPPLFSFCSLCFFHSLTPASADEAVEYLWVNVRQPRWRAEGQSQYGIQ